MEMPFGIDLDDLSTSLFVIFKYMVFCHWWSFVLFFLDRWLLPWMEKKGEGGNL
jgi:hypothetical protein